eukprot:3252594-Rhodomonas_salina.2
MFNRAFETGDTRDCTNPGLVACCGDRQSAVQISFETRGRGVPESDTCCPQLQGAHSWQPVAVPATVERDILVLLLRSKLLTVQGILSHRRSST